VQLEEFLVDSESQGGWGSRFEIVEKYGYDTKHMYHVIRLALEVEQILLEGNLTLDEKGRREHMKAIRNGEWTVEQVEGFFEAKEKHLEDLYNSSTLPYKPDEDAIKELLLNCLEHHYGSLDACVVREDQVVRALREIAEVIDKNRGVF